MEDDLQGQRVSLTEAENTLSEAENTEERKEGGKAASGGGKAALRDSAKAAGLIAGLLAVFGLLAAGVLTVVTAAFRPPQEPVPRASADNASSVGRGLSLRPAYTWKEELVAENVWLTRCFATSQSGTEQPLTWAAALDGLTAGEFGPVVEAELRRSPHARGTFFWELPPLTLASASARPFEMVTVAAPNLAGAPVDEQTFAAQLSPCAGQADAVAFPNLGGDATLVSPCASTATPPSAYTTIGHFLREAPTEQKARFWMRLGLALRDTLTERAARPTWISTEGSGVSWLHVRLDTTPKYYHHKPYTRWEPRWEHSHTRGRAGERRARSLREWRR